MKVLWTFLFVLLVCGVSVGQDTWPRHNTLDNALEPVTDRGALMESYPILTFTTNLISVVITEDGRLEIVKEQSPHIFSSSYNSGKRVKDVYASVGGKIVHKERFVEVSKIRTATKEITEIYHEWEKE